MNAGGSRTFLTQKALGSNFGFDTALAVYPGLLIFVTAICCNLR